MRKKGTVLGVSYEVSNIADAVSDVKDNKDELSGGYACFSNVHTLMTAVDDKEYMDVLNNADRTFPDGAPIASRLRKMGFREAERVAGPDFMEEMFERTKDGSLTHFFYGSKEETLEKLERNLSEKYPGIRIKGMYSPSFGEVSPEEDEKDVELINEADADIVWVGLGSPKQDKWMAANKGRVKGFMCGVGAGFDFHAGTMKRAPLWMRKMHLEWFFRLISDPKRLLKRYVVSNSRFIWYTIIGK
ncbi:MAG: WecB/TagA/CpsF family glycosyltransferase [Lachnospiraceae bacterium]|nr:WecB/TagA/CpsF family glycosyltransferase [Lachnospiraceae bacterium]